jgi:hypothetical protein
MFMTITATAAERASGALESDRLAAVAAALWEDGAVALAGVLDPAHVETVRSKMEADVPEQANRRKWPSNHFEQGPPLGAPYVFGDIIANPIAAQVGAAVVGSPLQLTLLGGNTILPCTDPQGLHRDHGNLWADADYSHRPANVSVHIPLVDFDQTNGSTELWPGTHKIAHEGAVPTDPAALDARAAIAPPSQVTCPVGGIIVRDGRAWHRGMPNLSDRPRVMISMIYAAVWARSARLPFLRSAEPALRDAPIEINPVWVDDDFDHLLDRSERSRVAASGV